MITFFAPASRCFCAPSRLVKSPVDSITTSTPSSRHGRFAGSRSASPLSSRPAALIEPSSADTPPANGPSTESYASRCAMVGTSPRSLNATSSNAASRSSDARKKLRPMRPKPLMPTLVFAIARMLVGGRRGLPGNRQRQAVDLADLVAEVTHVGLGVDPRRAGRALERLRRRELAAVAVQVLAQPLPQRSELAALELALEPGEVGGDPLPELHRDQVAERVRREVAERAARPVHVLEHAPAVVGHLDPQVLPHAAVPLLRELLEPEALREQVLLELEAHDDVEVVRRLVGLDADQRRLDGVHLPVPALGVVAAHRLREELAQAREEEGPERPRAPDEVLPHPALGLVHPERRAPRERRPLERRVDLVLVEAVPALVHGREEAVEVPLEVPRRDADVLLPRPARERVDGRVEPPRLVVEAEPAHDLELERALPDNRGLVLLQVVEDRAHLGGPHPALVVVEDDVVGLVVLAVEAVDVAAAEVEVRAQDGQERREVVLRARPHPDRVAARGGTGELRPELRRHPARLLVVAPRHADEARLEGVVGMLLLEALELLEQAADLGRGELLVGDATERRERLRTVGGAPGRHHRVLVPGEHLRRPPEVGDLGEPAAQLLEGGGHPGHLTRPGGLRRRRRARRAGAGRRGSSEDDLPLRRNHAQQRWRRTGSGSVAGRAWARRGEVSSARRAAATRRRPGRQRPARARIEAIRWWAAALLIGGRHFAASSASESEGWRRRSRAISCRRSGSVSTSSARIAPSCSRAARIARRTFASSAFASRFASARADATTACSPRRSAVSLAPARASRPAIASRLFAYAAACVRRSSTPRATPSRAAISARRPAAAGVLARSSRCNPTGPESEPVPSSAPRR